MRFPAVIEYIQDADKVQSVRPAHRAYLSRLLAEGKLAACGPFTDGWGALIVYEAATAEEAEALLRADPFHEAGIFVEWTIRPWNPVMANRELFPG
ncbi:MAG: YciI family protein [Gemmataceae bacterium]|nr:YciI family protein [Gemmataceae bacterium]